MGFENLSFEFRACFGFRVSDFGFVLAGHRCPSEKMWDMLRSLQPYRRNATGSDPEFGQFKFPLKLCAEGRGPISDSLEAPIC